jgi:hypothetical protein
MHAGDVFHAWFIFNLHTKTLLYLQVIHLQNVQQYSAGTTPCINKPTPLYLLGEPASLLVVANTHPPFSLVCQQLPHPLAFSPLTLSHPTVHITIFTYIDNINNLSCLHAGHYLFTFYLFTDNMAHFSVCLGIFHQSSVCIKYLLKLKTQQKIDFEKALIFS